MTDVYLITRVPVEFRDLIAIHRQRRGHMSQSEFFRQAIREKMEREASDLLQTHPIKQDLAKTPKGRLLRR
jgi:hypothetical protein